MRAKNKTEKFFCAHCKTYYKHDEKNKQAMTCTKCLKKGLNDKKAIKTAEEIIKLKQRNERKHTDKGETEEYMLKKYCAYLCAALVDLGGVKRDFCFWKDNDFNIERQKKKRINTAYIDEKELLNLFIKKLKEDNIHEMDPLLYKEAVKRLLKPKASYFSRRMLLDLDPDFFDGDLVFDMVKINGKRLFRVMF